VITYRPSLADTAALVAVRPVATTHTLASRAPPGPRTVPLSTPPASDVAGVPPAEAATVAAAGTEVRTDPVKIAAMQVAAAIEQERASGNSRGRTRMAKL